MYNRMKKVRNVVPVLVDYTTVVQLYNSSTTAVVVLLKFSMKWIVQQSVRTPYTPNSLLMFHSAESSVVAHLTRTG